MLDQVDVPFLEDVHRSWKEAPPLRRMVAAFAGHKPPKPADLSELLAMFPTGEIR